MNEVEPKKKLQNVKRTFENLSDEEKKTLQSIIDGIESHTVIPVIGYELFDDCLDSTCFDTYYSPDLQKLNYKNNSTNKASFLKSFAEKFILSHPERYSKNIIDEFAQLDCSCSIDYINFCYRHFESDQKFVLFNKNVNETLETHFNLSRIPSSIIKLARIELFRFYIDTTVFRTLEAALTSYRLKREGGNIVYEVLSPNQMKFANEKIIDPNSNSYDPSKPIKNIIHPIVWCFFGCYGSESGLSISDIHMQEVLYGYINKQHQKYSDFFNMLAGTFKDCNFLFIGCSFKDWIFRFILRLLATEKLEEKNLKRKIVIDDLLLLDADKSRNVYITKEGLQSLNLSANDFVDILYKQLGQRHTTKGSSCQIFISFFSEDRDIAREIHRYISVSLGLDCFLDESDIKGGEPLNKSIMDGINDSIVFIPLVSENIDIAFSRKSIAFAEWDYALKRSEENPGSLCIMPLFTKKYNNNKLSLNQYLPESVEKSSKFTVGQIANPGGPLGSVIQDEPLLLTEFYANELRMYQNNCRLKNGNS